MERGDKTSGGGKHRKLWQIVLSIGEKLVWQKARIEVAQERRGRELKVLWDKKCGTNGVLLVPGGQ
ncbi:hypothetical protein RBB78_12770 [Tunturiibacter empetritectus]|uniref:hypothetical protein n=1 Tax=Tunturiibacter empetritectus TaxID=3069691 RepID=UPI003D9AC637